jgi:hypothetical protein
LKLYLVQIFAVEKFAHDFKKASAPEFDPINCIVNRDNFNDNLNEALLEIILQYILMRRN